MSRRRKNGSKRAAKVTKRRKNKQESGSPTQPSGFTVVQEQLPDRRLMEREMAKALGMFGDGCPAGEESPADAIYERALQASSASQRLKLATQAMQADENHIDARVLTIEITPHRQLALGLAGETVELAEQLLGAAMFRRNAGHFWGIWETRPYMRARLALVNCLIEDARIEAAVEHMQDMLRLNPEDNQGVRWLLVENYLRLNRWDEAEKLMNRFPDEASVTFAFSRALAAFRRGGDTPGTRRLLAAAVDANQHVVPLLTGARETRYEQFGGVAWGGEDEAQVYSQGFLSLWKSTPGAVTWLRKTYPDCRPEPEEPAIAYPDDLEQEIRRLRPQVKELPIVEECWLCVVDQEVSKDIGAVFIVSRAETPAIAEFPRDENAVTSHALRALMSEMVADGSRRRPCQIHFADPDLLKAMKRRLTAIGITAHMCEDVEHVNRMALRMRQHCQAQHAECDPADLLDLPIQHDLLWEIAWQKLKIWVPGEDGEPVQPVCLIVADVNDQFIVGNHMLLDEPDSQQVRQQLTKTMLLPAAGDPVRPGRVRVGTQDDRVMIADFLAEHGIECVVGKFETLDEFFADLKSNFSQQDKSPITAMVANPAFTPAVLGDYFAAAAEFYRAAPWSRVRPEDIVEMRCSELGDHPWYGIVMGQMGLELGVMLHVDKLSLKLLFATGDRETSEEEASHLHGIGMSYNDRSFQAPDDVAAADQFGWVVAGAEAWPLAYFVDRGQPREISNRELEMLTAALRLIPSFWQHHRSARGAVPLTVPVADREIHVTMKRFELF
ncbi:MAG: tetratricopeptide repeat protein [Planctomycetota bacterium]|nr:tetratricopeptide repeat protein [Planctomycetota bacterium]